MRQELQKGQFEYVIKCFNTFLKRNEKQQMRTFVNSGQWPYRCLLYYFLYFSITLLNITLFYLLISHTFAIVLLHGLPPPLKIFPSRPLLFAPWISAFHLGVISELTHIHYLKPITYLPFIPLPETLALQPVAGAGKLLVLPCPVIPNHPYFILKLHSVYPHIHRYSWRQK